MVTERQVLLIKLVEKLHLHESWCGETHIQKATYILQELADVNTDFSFILYKYGPYSFDLNVELGHMLRKEYLQLLPRAGYGPVFEKGPNSWFLEQHSVDEPTMRAIEFVASSLGGKSVKELEPLATALMVTVESERGEVTDRLSALIEKKPHLSSNLELAQWALTEVDRMKARFHGGMLPLRLVERSL